MKQFCYGAALVLLLLSSSACASSRATGPVAAAADESSRPALMQAAARSSGLPENPDDPGDLYDIDPAFFDDDLAFEEEDQMSQALVADPLAPFNRAMFVFNDRLYFWALKPAAQGYNAVVPEPVRSGVSNFFHNLKMPLRLVSCLLQGKGERAANELGRFMYNTTFGVLGFGNPARHYPELNPPEEDLGQTLGFYGIGNGFYIVWPVLGPSTLRDSVGRFAGGFANPVNYIEPSGVSMGLQGYEHFNRTSLRLGEYEALKESVFEPYVAVRDLYIQHRRRQVQE